MIHSMKLLEIPYNKIKYGEKTIEIRLYDDKRKQLQRGDIIEFSKLPLLEEKMSVEIRELLKFSTFSDLISKIGMLSLGYTENHSTKDLLESIYTIYSKEQEQTYGVLGIRMNLI